MIYIRRNKKKIVCIKMLIIIIILYSNLSRLDNNKDTLKMLVSCKN